MAYKISQKTINEVEAVNDQRIIEERISSQEEVIKLSDSERDNIQEYLDNLGDISLQLEQVGNEKLSKKLRDIENGIRNSLIVIHTNEDIAESLQQTIPTKYG